MVIPTYLLIQAQGPTEPQGAVVTVCSPSSAEAERVTDVRQSTVVIHTVPPQWTPVGTCSPWNTAPTPPVPVCLPLTRLL